MNNKVIGLVGGLLCIVMLGASCTQDIGKAIVDKILPVDNRAAKQNYCTKNKTDAENNLKVAKVADELKPVYEVWKQNFMAVNKMSEDFFDKHIFLGWIWADPSQSGVYKGYTFSYYYKLGDIYIRYRHNDSIRIKTLSDWQKFGKDSPAKLLSDKLPAKYANSNDLEVVLTNYKWGSIEVGNFRKLTAKPDYDNIKCEEIIKIFDGCDGNILPGDFDMGMYENVVVSLFGSTWDQKNCAEGIVDVLNKKLTSCNHPLSSACSGVIGGPGL